MKALSKLMMICLGLALSLPACESKSIAPPIESQHGMTQSSMDQERRLERYRELEQDARAAQKHADELARKISQLEEILTEEENKSQQELRNELERLRAKRKGEIERFSELEAERKRLQEEVDANNDKQKESQQDDSESETNQDGNLVKLYENRVIFYESDCLNVVNASSNDRANVNAYPCNATLNQRFNVEHESGNQYRIIARHSNKCINVEETTNQEGANIQQFTCQRGESNSELFRFIAVSNIDFKIQSVRSDKCFKIEQNGNVIQDNCDTTYTLFRWGTQL